MPAAIAAEAAKDQGKFWEMHDKLFANQTQLDRPSLEKYAQEIGLDMGKFKAALDAKKGEAQAQADTKEGTQFGVRGTPGFFINGRFLRGAQPFDSFKAVIDEELKKADEKLKSGVPTQYGYGMGVHDAEGERMLSHGGDINGFTTNLTLVPGQRLFFALLSNNDASDPRPDAALPPPRPTLPPPEPLRLPRST